MNASGTKSLPQATQVEASTYAAPELEERAGAFLSSHSDLRFVDVLLTDINGVQRAKRLPARQVLKVFTGGFRMPRSLIGVDVWGEDVFDNGLIMESGDSDGICVPIESGLLLCPWSPLRLAQLSVMMVEADGEPFAADPRQLLIATQSALKAEGKHPVAALEVEFYLFPKNDESQAADQPPAMFSPFGSLCAASSLDEQSAFIDDLYSACDVQGIDLGGVLKESGPGQFELNLQHQDCAVKAADQVILLRRAIKGTAAKHDMIASFMAKPFGDQPGNGMHAHLSLCDDDGHNVFAEPSSVQATDQLMCAIAGLLKAAPESLIFFAPHLNSYRRFQSSFHAPIRTSWGVDNRFASIRVPNDQGQNRRLEHRIAGADANPYLVLSAILTGLKLGLDEQILPQPPLVGSDYKTADKRIDADWANALNSFETGSLLSSNFGAVFSKAFSACKRQEIATMARHVTGIEYASYLRAF